MEMTLSDRQVSLFRLVCIAILFAAAGSYVIFTIHWPWMWDTDVMHYIVFLMKHGKVAYRDIYDMNMPGCYIMERWAIDIFGSSDLGWRFYEFTLLGAMTLAACVIAQPYDWVAGLAAGVLFAILHGIDLGFMAVEREEVMAVFLIIGYAFLFLAVRRSRAILMLPFGLSLGMAMLIKPTAVLFTLTLLLFAYFALKQRAQAPAAYVLYSFAGFGIVLVVLLNFLLPHSLGPFLSLERQVLPYYSSFTPAPWSFVLQKSLPAPFLFFLPAAILLAIANRGRADWEIWAVRIGVVLGALSYFVQRKGYLYHHYPLMAFVLLWFGLECAIAIKAEGWLRNLGVLGIAVAVLVVLPLKVRELRHARTYGDPFTQQLQADLQRLGGSSLQDHVQCLDVVTGCYGALYRLGLVQSTGFIGDVGLFGPNDGKVVPYYRQIFWDDMHHNPPQVIVVSNQWFGEPYSFDKLNAWPQFRDYLNSAYTVEVSRTIGAFYGYPLSYRIYVLNPTKE